MAVISNTVVHIPAGVTSGNDIVISGGELLVSSGGAIVGTIATQGGAAVILSGGTATGTTVENNSAYDRVGQLVDGVAISTLVASGGIEVLENGGVTSGALVLQGGLEVVGNGAGSAANGHAVGMTVNGGSATIEPGGTASGTIVTNGGTLEEAGTDSGTSVTSGTMNVYFGGVASGTSVGSSGALNVSAGGVVSALTTNDPNDPNVTAVVNVLSGGTVDGSTKINGGELISDAGAVFEPHAKLTIINTGELVLEQNTFKGTIKDFGGQDFMDLQKIKFIGQGAGETTATFANGVLQVAQGSHVADLHLAGTYTTANFALQSDGVHGTTVTFVP